MDIFEYIDNAWDTLQRGPDDLVEAAGDPKMGANPILFLPPGETNGPNSPICRELPTQALSDPDSLLQHGLLYLPHPYVVPGGRFNEMYGWDSYFINLGLLASGRLEQAKAMVDNHIYQVHHYGKVLNANRSYYLSRSQPPFLASMVADVYAKTSDKIWLENCWDALLKTYEFWTSEPHLTPETGLSRYFDTGRGPAPEVLESEKDEAGLTHYERLSRDFETYAALTEEEQWEQLGYLVRDFWDGDLTARCYRGDRTMRESGFDPSDRFGRFNLDIVSYNPVDLNSLLYKFECEMEALSKELDRPSDWAVRAQQRKFAMQRFWHAGEGLFFDWNWEREEPRIYPFATIFFPLWTGWATAKQAEAVATSLQRFLHPGGVVTSPHRSGQQWDFPFGWAPLQLVAAQGLSRYGYEKEAAEIAQRFRRLVEREFERTGTIVEKYDVVAASAEVSAQIDYGYSSNEVGFGWTNAVYLLLSSS